MKKLSVSKKILIAVCIVLVLAAAAVGVVMALKVDAQQAQEAALAATGGGEIVSREVSNEGLWNEYSYVIVNGDSWYEVEISGFGNVTEMEQNQGQYRGH